MADNVAITPGTGATVAADDIGGGVLVQRVKATWGPDGTANDTDVATGKPMPIQLRSSTGTAVAFSAASTAAQAADVGLVVAISPNSQNANGRALAASSTPIALSTEDLAEITSVKTSVELIDDAIKADDAAFTPGTTKVMMAGFQADESSTDSVDEGDAGAARMTLDRKVIVTTQPHTQGGSTPIRKVDLDEAAAVVKASRGQLYGFYIVNRTTSPRYLRFYNIAAASVTVGTSTIHVGPIEIPANASDHTALIINFPSGIEFDTAMSWAVTTGFADNDTGTPGANDILANAFIK